MQTGRDVVLAELDLGHVTVRAVRTRVSEERREMLAAEGTAVGDEIIEVRWGDAPSGQPVLSERPTMIIIDDSLALVFGQLPDGAVSAEAVAPDGERVACTIAPGGWLVVLSNNQLGAELYPVLFQDRAGVPVNPGLPADWEREPVGHREVRCPACGSNAWDMVTAAWQGTGHLLNTRWGYGPSGPGKAFVSTSSDVAVDTSHDERRDRRRRLPRLRARRPDRRHRICIWPTLGPTEARQRRPARLSL